MADDLPRTAEEAQTADLRATAKWLVAACAAIGAAVVAGLQLKDLGALRASPWYWTLCALAAVIALLVAVGLTLYDGASVIAARRPTVDEIKTRETRDWPNYPAPRAGDPSDPLIYYLTVSRRPELLGPGRQTIYDLLQEQTNVYRSLRNRNAVTIHGTSYDPNVPVDAAALNDLMEELRERIRRVCDAAGWYETHTRYRKLMRSLWWRGLIFLLGAFGFAIVIALQPVRSAVTVPIQSDVAVPNDKAAKDAGLSQECAGKVLSGAMVGGTLDRPLVVTRVDGGCDAQRITDTSGLVVIPVQSPKASTSNPAYLCSHCPCKSPCHPDSTDSASPPQKGPALPR
ncbi:hypothetical protein QFZ43_004867 [Streptomyces afghaniensis]|nr:hypothetical protein [Streptomyces afghaniensis]